ncbi:MAG: hypothetical protein ACOCYZ_03030 [Halococcoides sp.]
MDEKTEDLRDIFLDVADDETVVESQSETHGSLAGETDDSDRADRVLAVVERIREAFDRQIDCPDDAIVAIVEGFFAGRDDAAIADDLELSAREVFETRMALTLVSDDEAPLDADRVADEAGDPESVADRLDADPEAVERTRQVIEAREAARSVSQRFRTAFEDALPDAAISASMTDSVKDDGLREAAEDIETDVSL